jgi:drug/metabolite transporter (DMT)-like permease
VNINKGITYMLISALISAFSAVFIKILLVEIHLVELAFFRNLFGVIIILYFIYKNPIKSKRGKPFLLIARGILGALGMFTYFYSISTLPLGVAITLNKTSPIFGAIFAFLFLSEKLTKGNIVAMMIGFFGIILISKPMGFIIEFNMFIGLLSGIIAALAYTSIRAIKEFYDTKEIVLSFSIMGTILSFFLLVLSEYINIDEKFSFVLGNFIMPSNINWLWIILLGFSGTTAQFFMTKAYENEKTGIVGTIAYTNIPFAIFLGVLLGDNIPSMLTFIGISFIAISGILIAIKK